MSRKPIANQHPQCCRSLKLIYRQNLDLISIFLNYSFLIHRNNSQIRAFEFPHIILGMTCKVRTGKQNIPFLFLVIDNCSHFSSDELIKSGQRYKKYSIYHSYWIKKYWFYSIRWIKWIKSVLLFLIFQLFSISFRTSRETTIAYMPRWTGH